MKKLFSSMDVSVILPYRLLLVVTLLAGTLESFAQFISGDRAKNVAVSFLNERSPIGIKDIAANGISSEELVYHKGVPAYYIYNLPGDAFVIVSADERINPVLGYSFKSSFQQGNIPDCLEWLLEQYKEQIYDVVSGNLNDNDQEIKNEWEKYETGNVQKNGDVPLPLDVTPLTTTTWSQGCYYNQLCPADASLSSSPKYCGHVPTGCVATAFSQVMKYHNYPAQGVGSKTYTSSTYGTISANFGATTYNWSAMPNKLLSNNTAAATLLFHAGASINMSYTATGSSAYTTDVRTALVNNFKYSSSAQYIYKTSYTNTQWENIIRAELDAQRIVLISGYDNTANAGHAFIADGYQGTNSFHINWGWNGSCDGYFLLTALSPSSYSFNSSVGAIIGIQPSTVSCPTPSGLSVSSITPSGATLNWTAVSGASNGYSIKYKPVSSSSWTSLNSTSTTKSISGLSSSTAYEFQVKSLCSSSSSGYSASKSFTTLSSTANNISVTVGSGTGTTVTAPYGTASMDERVQFIITKSELISGGYTSTTNYIKSLAFNVSSASSQTMNGFTVRIGHTTASAFASSSFLSTTMTTVYSGNKVAATGWNTHTFTSPFVYNGTNNLLIEICWNNSSAASNSSVRYTPTTAYRSIYYKANVSNGGVCGNTAGTRTYNRPNVKLMFSSQQLNKLPNEEENEEEQTIVPDEFNITLYPNPAQSVATIHFDGTSEKAGIAVFDIAGRIIFSDNIYNVYNTDYFLPVQNFPAGIYQIVVQTENQYRVRKLVVQKL